MYGWKKEYLLEEMSFGQIVMYLNCGLEFKYPKPKDDKPKRAVDKSDAELRAERQKLREKFGTRPNVEGL